MTLSISALKLETPVIVAPMAGITDYPFRKIIRLFSKALLMTEFVSSTSVCYKNTKTLKMMSLYPDEHPIGVQIFGNRIDHIADAAWRAQKLGADIVDINLGCPVRKVVKNGGGAAWLRNPTHIKDLVRTVRGALNIPLTVKIRLGISKSDKKNYLEVAKAVEEGGADAITVHGRYADDKYNTPADWLAIAEVKKILAIPVIGNGDIFSAEDAVRMKNISSCDGVMPARGICGNPWLAKNIEMALVDNKKNFISPDYHDIVLIIRNHLEELVAFYGEKRAATRFKKHIVYYIKGWPLGAKLRQDVNHAQAAVDIKNIFNDYLTNHLVLNGQRFP